jgi:single-strand DNA-binding protein
LSTIDASFIGRAGSVPELKTSQKGHPWCAFSCAVGNGSDTTEVTWIRVTAFGSLAQQLCETVEKGTKLYCEGRLSLSTFTGRDGEQRTGLQLAAHHVTRMAPGANKPERRKAPPAAASFARPMDTDSRPAGGRPVEDTIPFGPEVR